MVQCKAKSKRTGERCGAKAVQGKEVCRHHGGLSLSGPDHPRWKDGRRSKYLPTRLAESYHEALADPDRLALSDEIALVDAYINDMLGTLEGNHGPSIFRELRDVKKERNEKQRIGFMDDAADLQIEMDRLIDRGALAADTWESLLDGIQNRRKLVATEAKRRMEMEKVMTATEVVTIIGSIAKAVMEYVTEPAQRDAVLDVTERMLVIDDRSKS